MSTRSHPSVIASAAAIGIQAYRNTLLRIMLPSCRFFPSCSAYALESVRRYGFLRGGARALRRILRCQPFARGGFDPVR